MRNNCDCVALSPFNDLIEIEKLFKTMAQNNARPARAELKETENSIIATFELPGVDKNDIDLEIHDEFIEVKVEKKAEIKDEESYHQSYQQFYRAVPLPKNIDSANAIAEYKNGILKIVMPKKAIEIKSKRLEIK